MYFRTQRRLYSTYKRMSYVLRRLRLRTTMSLRPPPLFLYCFIPDTQPPQSRTLTRNALMQFKPTNVIRANGYKLAAHPITPAHIAARADCHAQFAHAHMINKTKNGFTVTRQPHGCKSQEYRHYGQSLQGITRTQETPLQHVLPRSCHAYPAHHGDGKPGDLVNEGTDCRPLA